MSIVFGMLLLLVAAHSVWAIDPGTASGTLTVGADQIALMYSHVFHDDNKSGLLPGPELRIVITEHELPPELFPEVRIARLDRLVQAGKVRGVLLLVEPRHPTTTVRGRLLYAPSTSGEALGTLALPAQDNPFRTLHSSNLRVSGAAKQQWSASPALRVAYTVSFSAPRFRYDPVHANLTGVQALKSPPAQGWLAFVRACQEGDWQAVQALVTSERWQELETPSAQRKENVACQQSLRAMLATANRQQQIQRVLMRGVWAVIILRDKTVIALWQRAGTWQVD